MLITYLQSVKRRGGLFSLPPADPSQVLSVTSTSRARLRMRLGLSMPFGMVRMTSGINPMPCADTKSYINV